MLRYVLFDLDLFPDESSRESSQKRILALLEALTLCNQYYLLENPDTPLMYDLCSQGKIKYKLPLQFEPEANPNASVVLDWLKQSSAPSSVEQAFRKDQALLSKITNGEVFRDIPQIIANGGADCDNLACWRTAEIRHHLGVGAKPYITWRKRDDGGTTYHVVTAWPEGNDQWSSEDSSLLCGMKKDDGGVALEEERRKLGERTGEMLADLGLPKAERIVGDIRRRAQLKEAIGLILRGVR